MVFRKLMRRLLGDVDGQRGVDPKHREAVHDLDGRLDGSEHRIRRYEDEVLARIRAVQVRRDVISRDEE